MINSIEISRKAEDGKPTACTPPQLRPPNPIHSTSRRTVVVQQLVAAVNLRLQLGSAPNSFIFFLDQNAVVDFF